MNEQIQSRPLRKCYVAKSVFLLIVLFRKCWLSSLEEFKQEHSLNIVLIFNIVAGILLMTLQKT